MMPTKKERVI